MDDRPFFYRWFYILRAKWRAWRYKRKYGMNIEDGICEYGKHVVLTQQDDYVCPSPIRSYDVTLKRKKK